MSDIEDLCAREKQRECYLEDDKGESPWDAETSWVRQDSKIMILVAL